MRFDFYSTLRPAAAIVVALWAFAPLSSALAEDRADMSTLWYLERRRGPLGGLSVVHPQLNIGVDAGDTVSFDLGYSADVVSGATSSVYSVDAVSSATKFSDTRHQSALTIGFKGKRSALSFTGGAGYERDYTSITAGSSGNVDLPGRNTNLALSYTRNFDNVCDRDNGNATTLERRALTGVDVCERKSVVLTEDRPGMTTWRELSIDTTQATITQNVSPTLVVQGVAFGQIIRGFQANPYRRVRVAGVEPQESLPGVRGRLALMLRANKFLPKLRSTVHGLIRGYSDTWGVNSATMEMGYSQYAGDSLLFNLRARIYQQSEATFFKDAFFYQTEGPAGEYFTGDRELAPIRNVLIGGRLSYMKVKLDDKAVWGMFDDLSLDLRGAILLLDELPANPLGDNPEGISRQFLSSGQLLDAIILGLGLDTTF